MVDAGELSCFRQVLLFSFHNSLSDRDGTTTRAELLYHSQEEPLTVFNQFCVAVGITCG